MLLQAAPIVEAYRLAEGCGVVASLPLSSHFRLGHCLILPIALRSPIGLVEQFDHRFVLALFMSEKYFYWASTPLMADVLARAPLPEPRPPAPRVCHISAGRLSEAVFRAFLKRFEVALRPSYGRIENGFITAEPSWLQPRILLVTAEIPRLPSGKVDRQTCVTILAKASGAAGA